MGCRSLYRRADTTPAPSAYTLPKLLGNKITGKVSSAAYSMTSRPKVGGFDEDLAKTPGTLYCISIVTILSYTVLIIVENNVCYPWS